MMVRTGLTQEKGKNAEKKNAEKKNAEKKNAEKKNGESKKRRFVLSDSE